MIYKNKTFAGRNDVTIAEFIKEKPIMVAAGLGGEKDNKQPVVLLKSVPYDPSGSQAVSFVGKDEKDFQPDLMMIFENAHQIDLLIDGLQEARERAYGEKANIPGLYARMIRALEAVAKGPERSFDSQKILRTEGNGEFINRVVKLARNAINTPQK